MTRDRIHTYRKHELACLQQCASLTGLPPDTPREEAATVDILDFRRQLISALTASSKTPDLANGGVQHDSYSGWWRPLHRQRNDPDSPPLVTVSITAPVQVTVYKAILQFARLNPASI